MTTETQSEQGVFGGIPASPMANLEDLAFTSQAGERTRYSEDLGRGGTLDAAFLRQDSDTLIVTFHGLLDRERFAIPRFERARSTEPFGTSCLYWADPSLSLDPKMKLAWFTGTETVDLFTMLAERSSSLATSIGATRLVFTGSSGGGFAALQTSALVPGSTALVFNPQTSIYNYLTSTQRRYLLNCRPDVLNGVPMDRFDFSEDWSAPLDDRYSALRRYSRATGNKVIYHSNTLDWHDEKHRKPFEEIVRSLGSVQIDVHTYEQNGGHQPPSHGRFTKALQHVLG